jgi:hypothetical protein
MAETRAQFSERYFEYLARYFPVMCASDEFDFLPRAQKAVDYYDRLERMSERAIEEYIANVTSFRHEFQSLAEKEGDLQKKIDLELLAANATGILVEFEQNRSWRHNPLLYLKIAFVGLDHALTKPAGNPGERSERAYSRLCAIPGLIREGMNNIAGVPESYHGAAGAMVKDCRTYLLDVAQKEGWLGDSRFEKSVCDVLSALGDFSGFLASVSPVPDRKFDASSIEERLRTHYLSRRDLSEVFQIAVEEWHCMTAELEKLRLRIDPDRSWQTLYHTHAPEHVAKMDTFAFYGEEIDRVCRFFSEVGLCEHGDCRAVELAETPGYLTSVRSGASFAASLTADKNEKSFFYITTRMPGKDTEGLLRKRFYREHIFLIAHETMPGHHMLDTIRRKLENPVRRQIESALFYEGWASYAEGLLFEYGYMDSPMAYLIHCKRRLWRSARCQIDAGLPQGFLTRKEAVSLLTTSGFAAVEAERQIDRFHLNPGYQLCYYLGAYEFRKLKQMFETRMDATAFYKLVLSNGELPFHLIEQIVAEWIDDRHA